MKVPPPRGSDRALPLVLLPGTLCDARVWSPMLQAWPGTPPASVAPTLSGQRSTHAMARAVLGTLPPRFALMGFSLGGIVALEIAAQAPRRVAGLALVATNARGDLPASTAARRAGVAAARVDLRAHLQRDLWPRYVARTRLHDPALAGCVLQMALDVGIDVYDEQADIAEHRADSRARLAQLEMPVLLASGDEDPINPPDRQAEIARELPSARWLRLPDVGHFVPLEAPAALAAAAHDWWEQARRGSDARSAGPRSAPAV